MTLARRNTDGTLSIGGVWCISCEMDTYHRVLPGGATRCDRCQTASAYVPRAEVVRVFRCPTCHIVGDVVYATLRCPDPWHLSP